MSRRPGRLALLAPILAVVAVSVAACGDESDTAEPGATTTTTTAATTATTATTATPTTAAPPVSTASTPRPSPVLVTEDGFLGIVPGTPLAEAADVLGTEAESTTDPALGRGVEACTHDRPFWAIRSGGLALVFEGRSADDAVLTNWGYTGGPFATFTELVVTPAVAIGDGRDELNATFPERDEHGDVVDALQPFPLRALLADDVVVWFGLVDCARELEPDS